MTAVTDNFLDKQGSSYVINSIMAYRSVFTSAVRKISIEKIPGKSKISKFMLPSDEKCACFTDLSHN